MDIIEQIERLEQLHSRGTLSDIEFQSAKNKLLNEQSERTNERQNLSLPSDNGMIYGIEENTWCALMHLSQLLTFSAIGIVVPIAMWIVGNEKSAVVRRHGHRMMNWIISSLIYAVVSAILIFVFIGFPLLIILAILTVVFPIIAAVKATQGEVWSYPLTIKFFSED